MRRLKKGDKVFLCHGEYREPATVKATDYRRKGETVYIVGDSGHFGIWVDPTKGPEWPLWLQEAF